MHKSRHIKNNLTANLEVVAEEGTDSLGKEVREDFQRFLRAYTDMLTNNAYLTKDDTYHNLKRTINNKTSDAVPRDHEVVIIKGAECIVKMLAMIHDRVICSIYNR